MINFLSLSRILQNGARAAVPNVVLDDADRAILGALSRNARISYRELAEVAHLSANASAERVRRLQDLGVLRGFVADIDPSSLGLLLQAFIDVKLQKGTTMDRFERAVSKIAGVQEAVSITGAFDARLRVVCEDPRQLGELIEQIRVQTGAQETSSAVITRELRLERDGVGE
jgi:Lrp/AsnC family leucine-responsive transcriptional regulator